MRPILTPDLARAAATDAGNRSMRNGNRTAWSAEDYDAACDELARLTGKPYAPDCIGCVWPGNCGCFDP